MRAAENAFKTLSTEYLRLLLAAERLPHLEPDLFPFIRN
jgi:hypothetical protein